MQSVSQSASQPRSQPASQSASHVVSPQPASPPLSQYKNGLEMRTLLGENVNCQLVSSWGVRSQKFLRITNASHWYLQRQTNRQKPCKFKHPLPLVCRKENIPTQLHPSSYCWHWYCGRNLCCHLHEHFARQNETSHDKYQLMINL